GEFLLLPVRSLPVGWSPVVTCHQMKADLRRAPANNAASSRSHEGRTVATNLRPVKDAARRIRLARLDRSGVPVTRGMMRARARVRAAVGRRMQPPAVVLRLTTARRCLDDCFLCRRQSLAPIT